VTALGVAFRWVHLAASVALVGACAMALIAGRTDRPTARAWETRVLASARWLVVLALAAGLGTLAWQTALLEGRAAAVVDRAALARVLLDTQAGVVWLARHGFLVLLAAFLAARPERVHAPGVDWLAGRGEALLLGAAALVLAAASGHAAAVDPGAAGAIAVDAVHLLAAGVWIGALLPLAALLRAASTETGADARPHAVLATRRFSRCALAAVVVLVATGVAAAATHVGSVAGLIGTAYGRLLCLKLGLLVPVLGLGAVNRRRLIPALAGPAEAVGRPAMRRLARFVAVEAGLALAVLAVVALLGLTPPARHESPVWPLPFRLSWSSPAAQAAPLRVLVATQVAVLGAVAILAALVVRRALAPLVAAGALLVAAGAAVGLPPLGVDAYPTTYLRPSVPYTAGSIASGLALYEAQCGRCHGAAGGGDGPEARATPVPAADLRSAHTAHHTAGDLFGWITHGIPAGGMPAFGDRLDEEQRWDVVNAVRALGAAPAARALGTSVEPGRATLVAPDFTFTVGPGAPRSLRDYRGRRAVVVVLYTLPASRPRLVQLAERYDLIAMLGADVVAVPVDAAPDAIRRLGGGTRFLYPVVTGGAADIVRAYGLFAGGAHAELLVDRQGYLRAAWSTSGPTERDVNLLLAELQALNEEKAPPPAAEEHVH
jgi:putative copper resistance protein D